MATFVERSGPDGRRVWQAKIRRCGYPPQSGTFDSKGRAEAWARQIEGGGGGMDRGVFVSRAEAENTTLAGGLGSLCARGLTDQKSARSAAYHAHNVHEALGTLSLSAITSSALAKYRDRQLAEGYAAQTVKHDLSLISRVLNICIKEWGIALPAGNPVTQVKMPSLPPGRDRRLVAMNGLFQAAKRKARGYGRFATIRTVTFLIAGKLDF